MDQSEKDRIAAEIAADYRSTIRETAEAERRNSSGRAYSRREKPLRLVYFFWFSFGTLGIHRFYLGYPLSGAAMLLLGVLAGVFSFMPSYFILGMILGGALSVWWMIDAFLIPRMASGTPDY